MSDAADPLGMPRPMMRRAEAGPVEAGSGAVNPPPPGGSALPGGRPARRGGGGAGASESSGGPEVEVTVHP